MIAYSVVFMVWFISVYHTLPPPGGSPFFPQDAGGRNQGTTPPTQKKGGVFSPYVACPRGSIFGGYFGFKCDKQSYVNAYGCMTNALLHSTFQS
jgi:hypothetical protein